MRLLPVPLAAIAVTYLIASLLPRSDDFSFWIDGALGLLTVWAPAVVAWSVVGYSGGRRPYLWLVATALLCWAFADTYYVLEAAAGRDVPLPSPADLGYGSFYVLLLVAVILTSRAMAVHLTWSALLDSVIGALGAAAVLALALDPVVKSTFDGPLTLTGVVGVSYCLMDVLIIIKLSGTTAAAGGALGRSWALLYLGVLVLTGADIAYAFLEVDELYAIGAPLDAVWAIALALISAWAVTQRHPVVPRRNFTTAVPAQTIPLVATAAGLVVLVAASQRSVVTTAVVLAGLTVALAALPLAFLQRLLLTQVNRHARTDELTGIANRRALYTDFPRRLAVNAELPSAVLLLDLDKFKEINDGLGHDKGDQLLQQVAARLIDEVGPLDLLARMGGDEFVIHPDQCDRERARAVALGIRTALAAPYDLGGVTIHISASIGISCYPLHGQELGSLLRKADIAMYAAKTEHTGYAVYSDCEGDRARGEFHTVQALNEALTADQLVLHYQPKIGLADGRVCGVEALVRWEHPVLGLLQPDAFLGRFDEAGLMPALTDVVLEQALDQAAVWSLRGRPLPVAVNLPASSIMDAGLPAEILAMTTSRALDPSILVIEITEDVLISDRSRAAANLRTLRQMGVRIAVDDFGKGYSSLSYLRELPIDELKLDKSFILSMMSDTRATALVVSTIDLAHSLGLEMTAEGVEDTETYRALGDYGCDLAQGYFMSRPVPAADLDTWLGDGARITRQESDLPVAVPPEGDARAVLEDAPLHERVEGLVDS
ncbi:bifunctional diguanylate cyclase/phosphodiesterase [uncultured Arthrobacter sp.]|uniref:putative bifunctional diguanylate cyclase/phosphodiesterase n=1 Tax=uncultured Arthrobacter sp. TaxID=114050 RepID=UPI00261C9B95|nr:EAL domain-containing protein [uncultured Arthrobacter sp.]